MLAKQRVLCELRNTDESEKWITAKELARVLNLSRQNVSHYLTQLLSEKEVLRQDGRPVLWKAAPQQPVPTKAFKKQDKLTLFSDIVGYNGSLREAISKCISAVEYPDGLSLLLQGPSGVGKSFLAHKVFDFAKKSRVISSNAPLLILNCADYADNPELLSATLFGYKRGAFTGAIHDEQGLLGAANNGFLFLDEVHRLSSENQEKLFLFMDSGKYRPLGENGKWSASKVRLIFATTEDANEVFLETFKRRIEVTVHLPAFAKRPLKERLALIVQFFNSEAVKLQRNVTVSGSALSLLANTANKGNVGQVRSVIKMLCADEYSLKKSLCLHINVINVERELGIVAGEENSFIPDLNIDWRKPVQNVLSRNTQFDELSTLINRIVSGVPLNELEALLQEFIIKLKGGYSPTTAQKLLATVYDKKWQRLIVKKYGILQAALPGPDICQVATFNFDKVSNIDKALANLNRDYPRSIYLASQFVANLPGLTNQTAKVVRLVASVILAEFVQEKMPLKGLLIAHGENTASSIQSVVNQLCGNYIFEAIDMPMDSGAEQIVERVKKFINTEVKTDSLVLLVDMGSLNQLYKRLKNDLKGELLVIDNLTTAVALDIGLKIQNGVEFDKIAEDASANYKINIQYFEGFARKSNIIISCMSGLGISEQLSAIFSKYLGGSDTDIFTRDYRTVRRLIDQNDQDYFKKTKLVITTSALPRSFNIPNINIYDILDPKGSSRLEALLSDELPHKQFRALMQELVRFFSLEGIADRLNFLNPKMVISEVETVVSKYENVFKLSLTGTVELNLYMHIALMMERLFIARADTEEASSINVRPEAQDFFEVSRSIFQPMEMKYRFKVNDYELSLLYEIFKPFITE